MTEPAPRKQRHIALILAKDLAANLATAMLLVDADGDLVFFNEPAELILGRPYAEAQMSRAELAKTFKPVDEAGEAIPLEELPLTRAVRSGIPSHGHLRIEAVDGRAHDLEVVGMPLFAQEDQLVGGLAVFLGAGRGTLTCARGSGARAGPSCIEVRPADGSLVILDSGTGIRALGAALDGTTPKRIDILLSHLHLDHLEGLGFFAPLWDPGTELHVWGPPSPTRSLSDRISQYLSPPLFPVRLAEVPSRLQLHDAPYEPWMLGSATITARPIIHRGPTVGYRIEDAGRSLAYLTDHEPALAVDLSSVQPEWVSGFEIAAGVDVLIHDCQYTEEEYPDRAGFGHSSTQHVADFARLAGARRLMLFHHDPNHTDDDLESLCARVRELWSGGTVDLAREGEEIDFG